MKKAPQPAAKKIRQFGPWPINYINQATKLDVLDDVENFSANVAATRSDVAIMLAETLDQKVVYWNSDKAAFKDDLKNEADPASTYTLLDDAFDGASGEYIVTDVTMSDAVDGEYAVEVVKQDDVDEMGEFDQTEFDKIKTTTFDANLDTSVANGEFYSLIGRQVTIINDDNDAKYIQVNTKIVEVGEAEAQGDTRVKLDGKSYKLADAYYVDLFTDDETNITGYAALNKDDEVYAVFSDQNREVAYINPVAAFVTDVDNVEDDEIDLNGVTNEEFADDDVIIVKAGERVYAKDLAVGDVLKAYVGVNDIYFVDTAKEGKVSAINGTKVTLGDQKYETTGLKKFDGDYEVDSSIAWTDYKGSNVKFVLAPDNTVSAAVFAEAGTSSEYYGVLTDFTYATNKGSVDLEATYEAVKIFTSEGKVAELDVDTDATDVKGGKFSDAAGFLKGHVVQYKLNKDGEIKSVKQLNATDVYESKDIKDLGTSVDVDDNKYINKGGSRYTVNNDAIIFNIKDDCEVELLTKAQLLAGEDITASEIDDVEAYATATMTAYVSGTKVEIFVVTDCNASSDWTYAVVDEVIGETEDMDNAVKFTNLEDTYELDGATVAGTVEDGKLVAVKFNGTDVKEIVVIEPNNDASLKAAAVKVLKLDNDGASNIVKAKVANSVAEDLVGYDGGQFKVTADTKYVYVNKDGDFELKNRLAEDKYISAIVNNDKEAELVIVFNSNPNA
ncbi:MAG: hypothetical protein ACOX7J_05170 [Bacillota bacterium]